MIKYKIPQSHPRYESLKLRERLIKHFEEGIVAESGLIAHGRGEAFDYILGEKTVMEADEGAKVAAAHLLLAKNPVISVNGNTAALAAKALVQLANIVDAKIEINLFHRTEKRIKKIEKLLKIAGAKKIYNIVPDARIPYIEHSRALCSREGIYTSDVVLVSIEDGDRTEALCKMGKIVIAIDLNPFSRTATTATVTIVDNIVRAIPNIRAHANRLKYKPKSELMKIVSSFDNTEKLATVKEYMYSRLRKEKLFRTIEATGNGREK